MALEQIEVNSPMGTAVRCPTCSKMYDANRYPEKCDRCTAPMDEEKAFNWAISGIFPGTALPKVPISALKGYDGIPVK